MGNNLADLIYLLLRVIEVYSVCLGLYALLSWFPGGYDNFFGQLLARICEPYLRLFDRLNLNFGGIGFTVIAAIFVLNIVSRVLAELLFRVM